MAVQNLITTRSSSITKTTGVTVYTVPATIGGGNVDETFIIDMVLTNLVPSGDDVFADVIISDPATRYLAKSLLVPGTNQLSELEVWNNNEKIYAEPVRVSFKIAGLNVGDVVSVEADTTVDHEIPILAFYAGIHITNDL